MEHVSLGSMQLLEDKVRFIPNSVPHYRHGMSAFPLGSKVRATYKLISRSHTPGQHAYHFVLCGYIAKETGYTKEQTHDAMMKLTFGVKQIKLLGKTFEARESMANAARLTTPQCVELIEKDLEVCADLGIVVPTKEELGYISNK